eukprot:1058109-Amphidinium_carterae.1
MLTALSRKVGAAQPVKGTNPDGRNQLTEGEMRCFYNLCPYASMENMRIRPHAMRLVSAQSVLVSPSSNAPNLSVRAFRGGCGCLATG